MNLADYVPIVMMFGVGLVFGVASLLVSRLLAPRKPTKAKQAPYECGIVADREPPERFPVRFYMVAMLFILFDIEIVFMFPWAVAYRRLGLFGFVEMALFIAALLVAYIYVWREGILDWNPRRLLKVRRGVGTEPAFPVEREAA